jgi:fatty acid amide hydrolase
MARDRSLLRLSLHQMADLLARHEVSSTELVRAHLDRLDEIQPRLRPMASIFHERAMAMAAGSDNRRRAGQVRGPLDGLPLTLKENFDLVGEPTTLGMPGRRDHRAESEGVLVGLLREAGCVFLGKTNLSQAMLFHESRNPLFGQTANP